MRKIDNSLRLKKEAENFIPGCSQTFSKGPSQFVQGVAPVFIERGKGPYVWDVDANKYIDYSMALGPVILGYAYQSVNKAITSQLENGITYSLPHPLELELSKILADIIPCAEMVRFGKNGSDATSGAVRAARAYTKREKIACCGYHGWQDWFIGTTTRCNGVPKAVQKLTFTFEYNKIETLQKIFDEHKGEVAAVIMEPVGLVEPKGNFLNEIREITHKNGALLIFDEIITGFRISLGGAQEYFGITPDLACFGKAMANGMPISAITGRKDIMKIFDQIFFSFTFGGESLSLAAAIATIQELREKKVIDHLWRQGQKLKEGYNELAKEVDLAELTNCSGFAPRTVIWFKNQAGQESLEYKTLFQQEVIKRGVLFSGSQNICFSHADEDINYTLAVYQECLTMLKKAISENTVRGSIKGRVVEPVFRKA